MALLITKDFKNFERMGRIFEDKDDKDVIIFPDKIRGKYIILDRIYPNITLTESERIDGGWRERRIVMEPQEGWEDERVGGSTVPYKTEKGWLLIYHAADQNQVYRLGFVLLDLTDPSKVIYRHPEPILEPEESYEKKGRVPNVVFSCGMAEVRGRFFVYYCGADRVLCLATIEKKKILGVL